MTRGIKTFLIWGLLLGVVFFAILNRGRQNDEPTASVAAEGALKMIDSERIIGYRIRDQELLVVTNDRDHLTVRPHMDARVINRLEEAHVPFLYESDRSDTTNLVAWIVVAIGALLALYYFLRKIRGGEMNNIFALRKSKARTVKDENKARFSDIGGNREAVELLSDIVDFLRSPERWLKVGTRLPRGVLVVGPPGTGKTLLARAVAGETQSAFFYTSAAEFVEMFVGVGAARVRDTFEKGAAQRPAVIFIDELDAIGRRRGSGFGAMHEEREQTLNQLLVLMDGLEKFDRLVVMAATNRPDVLDPALLRSGRFDRVLRLSPPTFEGRVEILKIHTRNKPLDTDVSLELIARKADSLTGADLESLTNDAALMAVRRNRDDKNLNGSAVLLTMADFDQAFEAMTKSQRQFDRLDSVLVESVSQFAEPTGRAVARVTLTTGTVIEGDVLWMNSAHIKLRVADGSDVIVAKQMAEQIVPLIGTELAPQGDFTPDPWASKKLNVG